MPANSTRLHPFCNDDRTQLCGWQNCILRLLRFECSQVTEVTWVSWCLLTSKVWDRSFEFWRTTPISDGVNLWEHHCELSTSSRSKGELFTGSAATWVSTGGRPKWNWWTDFYNWRTVSCWWFFPRVTSTSAASKRPRFWLQTLLARQPSERPTAAKLAHDVERYRLLGEACWRNRDMWKMVFEAVASEFGSHRCNTWSKTINNDNICRACKYKAYLKKHHASWWELCVALTHDLTDPWVKGFPTGTSRNCSNPSACDSSSAGSAAGGGRVASRLRCLCAPSRGISLVSISRKVSDG